MMSRPDDRRLPVGLLFVAVAVIAVVAIARWLGSTAASPGAEASPSDPSASATPAVSAAAAAPSASPETPVPTVSATTAPSATPPPANGDCGRISTKACAKAIAVARKGHEADVAEASRIVVDDACPPTSVCDRKYPFDAFVVFVTAGGDSTGWYYGEVVGLQDGQPTKVRSWQGDQLPAHIVEQLRAPQPTP